MTAPYSFTRREDGPGNTISASHVNELQQAVEEIGGIVFSWGRVADGGYLMEAYGHAYAGGTSFSADTLYFLPVLIGPGSFTIDLIQTRVSSAGTGGSTARIGIYTHNATTYAPDDLVDDIGTIAIDSTGVKTVAYGETIAAATPDYVLWLACVLSASASLVATGTTSPSIHPLGAAGTSDGEPYHGYSQSHTYGALPASAGTLTAITRPISLILKKGS